MITWEQEREELIATVCCISAWCFDSILCMQSTEYTNAVDIKQITHAMLCHDKIIMATILLITSKTIHLNIFPLITPTLDIPLPQTCMHIFTQSAHFCLSNYVCINIWWTTKMFAPCHIFKLEPWDYVNSVYKASSMIHLLQELKSQLFCPSELCQARLWEIACGKTEASIQKMVQWIEYEMKSWYYDREM